MIPENIVARIFIDSRFGDWTDTPRAIYNLLGDKYGWGCYEPLPGHRVLAATGGVWIKRGAKGTYRGPYGQAYNVEMDDGTVTKLPWYEWNRE